MAEHDNATPIHRATLLVGYGHFGLATLRRFLISTATRGILNWEEGLEQDRYERHLRDLILLYIPAASEENLQMNGALGDQSIELMRDLYRQIETVNDYQQLPKIMEEKAKSLLNAATRAARDENLPLGLDVIILAQPAKLAVIGQLRPLLTKSLDHLHQHLPQLQRQMPGANALNFIQLLDFDNYWQQSEDKSSLREAVASEANYWKQRRDRQQPSFSRIYLVDSQTHDGVRDEKQRIDEISLFLEFLLFEGQRDGDLQFLYQPPAIDETLVATFGIRLLERSAGLLTRLAAASFGIGWLDYLASNPVGTQDEMHDLQALMKNYEASSLAQSISTNSPAVELDSRLALLQEQLESIAVDSSNWLEQVQSQYEQAFKEIKNDLFRRTHDHIQTLLNQEPLSTLSKNLPEEIDRCFHHDRHPATLGAVIYELEAVIATLNQIPVFSPSVSLAVTAEGTDIKRLHEQHREYLYFLKNQLDTNGVKKWWPLFSFMLSLGINTTVMEELAKCPEPDPLITSPLMTIVLSSLHYLSESRTIVMLTLGFGFWAILAFWGQGAVAGRVLRAKNYWNDGLRSRLKDSLRKLLRSDSELNLTLKEFLAQMQKNTVTSIQREVIRELNQVLKSLLERKRELDYLHEQLTGFLTLYGIDPRNPNEAWNRMAQEASGIRYAVENYADFQRILSSNPSETARFLSMQAKRKPFKNWYERYSRSFLYPLLFIDELSQEYRDPLETELSKSGSGQQQEAVANHLKQFLQRHSNFSSAFYWQQQLGLPQDRVYCLLPPIWLNLAGIPETLTGLGITHQNRLRGDSITRAYLLRIKTGVDISCLT
jgi:hypothetical protein